MYYDKTKDAMIEHMEVLTKTTSRFLYDTHGVTCEMELETEGYGVWATSVRLNALPGQNGLSALDLKSLVWMEAFEDILGDIAKYVHSKGLNPDTDFTGSGCGTECECEVAEPEPEPEPEAMSLMEQLREAQGKVDSLMEKAPDGWPDDCTRCGGGLCAGFSVLDADTQAILRDSLAAANGAYKTEETVEDTESEVRPVEDVGPKWGYKFDGDDDERARYVGQPNHGPGSACVTCRNLFSDTAER